MLGVPVAPRVQSRQNAASQIERGLHTEWESTSPVKAQFAAKAKSYIVHTGLRSQSLPVGNRLSVGTCMQLPHPDLRFSILLVSSVPFNPSS